MYINRTTNFSFLANQDSDDDLTPQVVRVEKEKDRNGQIREVLVLKFFCRVDREQLKKSNCQKIDLRLSKHDLSYYRNIGKLTQTKVAIAKISENKKESDKSSNDGQVSNFLTSRQEKRKDKKKKRKNRREARKNRRKNTRNKIRKGVSSLFQKNRKDSGDRNSRRRGGFKNRDSQGKQSNRKTMGKVLKIQNTGRRNLVKVAKNSQVVLEPKNLLVTAKASPIFRLTKNQDIYARAKKMASINFGSLSTRPNLKISNNNRIVLAQSLFENGSRRKNRLLEPDTILKISKVDSLDLSKTLSPYSIPASSLRTFQKQYLNMVESCIDPLHLFEDSFQKVSFNQDRGGTRDKVSSKTKHRKIIPVVDEIQRRIANISTTNYEFRKLKNPSRFKSLECTGRISLKDFQDMGNNGHVLFIAKDSNGLNMQAQSFSFKTSNVLEQIERQSTHVKCKASRNPRGVCTLSVSNLESSYLADFNIEVKRMRRKDNFVETDFEKLLSSYKLPPKTALSVSDGRLNTKARNPINFKASENLFFRTTINYRNKKYFNTNTSFSKGVKGSQKNDNTPSLNLVAKIDEQQTGMRITVNNISPNVSAVNLMKYRYTGSAKGKMLPTFNAEREINEFRFIHEEDSDNIAGPTVNFIDSDVFEDRIYMYVVECIMKNGERKMAPAYFIEKYEQRTESVIIRDIDVETPSFIDDASESKSSENNELTRSVSLNFKIEKVETEVDKIINNLFGNLFDIFSDELKKIKDVQGLVYSVEVQRIESKTGAASTVGKVTADKEGNCVFVDDNAPAFSDITYKLIPRVRPASEVINSVVSQMPALAVTTVNRPINFVSAAARVSGRNRKNRVFSAKHDKFSDRKMFKRGRVRPPKNILQTNAGDLFADASTGDIAYIDVGGLSDVKLFDTIEIEEGFINEIKHSTIPSENENILGSLKRKYFELEFETNNDFLVDFYTVFVKEGKNIYLDGSIHSDDVFRSSKEYRYLVEHQGSSGVVEYYIVPILKTGKILEPKFVAAQLIE